MNRLGSEKSPYLQQHRANPVHWYAWGPEAFAAAHAEGKLILLSIGYSTCHWCHVMERESFEDESVAALLNANFVAIKVDREEHPDVDALYMNAIHLMNQRGGWPLNVFLTPDRKPFYGGTYFPKDIFLKLLEQLQSMWKETPEKFREVSESIASHLVHTNANPGQSAPAMASLRESFLRSAMEKHDPIFGGHKGAPKFPHASEISLLLRLYQTNPRPELRAMITQSLEMMAGGGIFDHLEGGFHRYSTDEKWLVPHFEKMLYDQASLLGVYTEAWQLFKNPNFQAVSRKIADYLKIRLLSPDGLYFAAEDADSEGEEGRFYVWDYDDLDNLLEAPEMELLETHFTVEPAGNFEGKNILSLKKSSDFARAHEACAPLLAKLTQHRTKRIRPFRDEKILLSWNSLMIASLAKWARVGGDEDLSASLEKACDTLAQRFCDESFHLKRRMIDDEVKLDGTLEDYAFFIAALIEVAQLSGKQKHLSLALNLQKTQEARFGDRTEGRYFTSPESESALIARLKDTFDNVTPAANSVSFSNLVRLQFLTGDEAVLENLENYKQKLPEDFSRFPFGFPVLLEAYGFWEDPQRAKVSLVGTGKTRLEAMTKICQSFRPHLLFAVEEESTQYLLCLRDACLSPQESFGALTQQIEEHFK
jgi:uncharacterized protein YyaL (SSP411 family)